MVHPLCLNMSIRVVKKDFSELTNQDVYDMLDIRLDVFVTEQKIIYTDTDYLDQHSMHYMMYLDHKVVSYLRMIKPGFKYKEYSIGRVATKRLYRNQGFSTQLLKRAMQDVLGDPIRISAQAYLKDYYQKLGFIQVGEPYIEEGILHVEMLAINKE